MDTRATGREADPAKEAIRQITDYMPGVYAAVKAQAEAIGPQAYNLVRRAARGEPDCFYAMERGRVVGTPFCQAVMADVAAQMVEFGCTYLCIWPAREGGANGKA